MKNFPLQEDETARRKEIEDEFIKRGPMNLLEAVYCDPCKGKVQDTKSRILEITKIIPGCLLLPYRKLVGAVWAGEA